MGAHNHGGEWQAHIYLMGWGNTQQTVLCQCDITGVHGLRYSASREVYVVGPSMPGVGCRGGLWREMDPPFEMPGAPRSGAADTVTRCDQNPLRLMRSGYTCTRAGRPRGSFVGTMLLVYPKRGVRARRNASDAYCMIYGQIQ